MARKGKGEYNPKNPITLKLLGKNEEAPKPLVSARGLSYSRYDHGENERAIRV